MSKLFFSQNTLGNTVTNPIVVTPSSIIVKAEGETTIHSLAIIPQDAVPIITEGASWITAIYNSSTHKITVTSDANFSGYARIGIVTLTHPYNSSKKATITIHQY